MGRLADAVVQAGGKLTAIVPVFFTGIHQGSRERSHSMCTKFLFACASLARLTREGSREANEGV